MKLSGLVAQGRYEGDNMLPHVTIATFASSKADSLQKLVKKHASISLGRGRIDRLAVIKATLFKYYGRIEEQRDAFCALESLPLSYRYAK